MTKIRTISLDTLKKVSLKLFFKLLLEKRVAHGLLCALHKMMMVEGNGHIQSWISWICGKIAVYAGMFTSPLPESLWPPILAGW